jgi:hypothetical protein
MVTSYNKRTFVNISTYHISSILNGLNTTMLFNYRKFLGVEREIIQDLDRINYISLCAMSL